MISRDFFGHVKKRDFLYLLLVNIGIIVSGTTTVMRNLVAGWIE